MANKTFTPFLGAIKEMQDRVNNADYSIIKDDGIDSSVRSYYEQGTASSMPEAIKANMEEYVNKGLNENAYITDNEERYKNLGDDEMAKDLRDRAIQSWYAVDNLTAYNVPVEHTISHPMLGHASTYYTNEVKFYNEGQEIPKGATPLSQAEQIDAKNKRREEIIKTEEKFEFLSKSDRGKELLKDVYNNPNITSQGDYMKAINQAYSQYESEGLQKFVGTEIDRLDSEIAKLEEKNKKPYNFGRELSKATWGAYEGAREDKDLLRAKELLEEVKTSYQHLQEGAGFWKGLGNELFSWDTFTFGVESMLDNADIARYLNKFAEVGFDGLTETEKVVLDALIAREAMNSLPKGFLYNAGEAVGFSIPFMISYGLSKIPSQAIAKATSKATGAGIKKLGEYLSKRAAKEGVSQAIKKADDIIQKGVKKTTDFAKANPNLTKWGKEAGEVLTTGAMTSGIQTVTSPHTYGDYAERQAQVKYEVDYDDNGNVQIVGKGVEQDNNALAKAITSAFIDNMSEKVGGLLIPDGATTFMGKEIKSLVKNNLSPRQADFFKKVSAAWNNNPMREAAKAVDFGSFGQEFGEEIVAGVGNTLFVGDQTFEEFFSGENMLTTALSIGAISTAIGLTGGAINANEFRKSKRNYEESLRQLEQSIPDVATRNKIINQIATADYQGQNNLVQSIMATAREEAKKGNKREAQVLAERARNVVRFANAYNQVSVWNQALNVKLEERMKTERERIRQDANADMDNHTIIAQYEGENYLVIGGKVAFNQDGTIDLANSSESVTIKSPDGEKQIISPEKLSLVADMSFEELESQAQQMTWQRMEQELNTPTEETQPTQEAQPVAEQPTGTGQPSSTEVETTPENTQGEQPQQPSYPVDEEGEPIFTQMPIEQTNQVINELGENADTFVSNKINEAQSRLEKAQNAKVKATKFNEMKREAEAINQEKQSAQAELDYWTQVQQARQVTVTPTEEVTNTEQSADNTEVNEVVNTSEQPNDLNNTNVTASAETNQSNLTNETNEIDETQPSENTEQESNEANTTEETQTESLGEENSTEETRQRVTEEEQTQAAPMQLTESDQRAIRAEATRIEKGIRKMARELRKEWKGKDIYILEDMTDIFQRKFRQQIKENGLIGAIALNAKEGETAKQTLKRMLSPKFRGIFDGMNGEEIITSFSSHGFFKDSTGKVYVNMSANLNAEDLKVTLFHEAVAHKGLRELLGKDNFNRLCQAVAEAMPTEIKGRLIKAYSKSGSTITDALIADEYMASLAEQMEENNGELTIPQRIVGAMRNFFRNLFNLKLNEADIKYLLYASYKKLKGDEGIQTSINNSATLKRLRDVAVTQQADNAVHNRLVYHGSGAEFERFDHSYMGTGEGAQAYGWGTYVTDVEGIGRTYATAMRDKLISKKHNENAIINKLAKDTLEIHTKEEALNFLRSLLNEDWSDKKRVKAQIKIIETGKFLPETKAKAHLYNVDIPDDNGTNYIHWETNTQELADKLNDAYRTMLIKEKGVKEEDINPDFAPFGKGVSGGTIYKLFARELGGDKQASQFLSSLGFVGISYPAQATTGGRADGARNFVIFNEDDAQIVEHTRFRLGDSRLRELEEGEVCNVERIFTENKNFDFTSGERIESFDDVAFIFKQLQDESVENSFAVLVKNGIPTVIHLGMGGYTSTIVNGSALSVAVERVQPDKIYFVHNHPSGALKASTPDLNVLYNLKKVYGDKVVQDGIIINLHSGKYGTFGNVNEEHKEKNIENAVPIKVFSFNKQVFKEDYNPSELFSAMSAENVASFISSQRLGKRNKLGVLVCNNQLGIVGNIFTKYTEVTNENAKEVAKDIVYYTTSMGGNRAIIFGDGFFKDITNKRLSDHVRESSLSHIELLDYVNVNDSGYLSANEEGVRFRFIGEQGAMNLDKAEEATIRLDNLNVARQMEDDGKDAKTIKLATGWERGADGKWRYEVEDDYEFETPMSKIGRLRNELKEIEKRYDRLDYATQGRLPRNASDEQKERMKKLRKEFKDVSKQASDKRIEMYDTENSMGGVLLKEFIGEDNKLFKAYPQLADYYISFVRNYNYIDGGYNGYYSDRTIWINPYLEESKIKSVFAHEIQHAIQHIEGFAKGGNTETANALRDKAKAWSWRNALMETAKEYPELAGRKDLEQKLIEEYKNESLEEYIPSEEQRIKGFNLYVRGYDNEGYEEAYKQWAKVRDDNYSTYRNLSGEVESRNVQSRLGMTPEERRQSLASETEDVARKDQIFIYDGLESANKDGVRFSLGEKDKFYHGLYRKDRKINNFSLTIPEKVAIRKYIMSLPEDTDDSKPLYFENNGYIYKFNTLLSSFEDNLIDGDGFEIIDKLNLNKLTDGERKDLQRGFKEDTQTITEITDEFETSGRSNLGDIHNFVEGRTTVQPDGVVSGRIEEENSIGGRDSGESTANSRDGEITPFDSEAGVNFRLVEDPELIEKLESEPTIKVYRAMQLVDGKLYPPMSAKVDGEWRTPSPIGAWEEAEEKPELADNKGYFKLDKGNKTSLKARYNPYFHTSRTPLNDQFSSAQDRPELVTVEVEVPLSELTSGYKAEKAKDAVGELEWKAGVVQGKLSGTRKVILSRWSKPVRVVPDSEVAQRIVEMFGDREITMPSNVVTPSLRAELEKLGVPFVETDNQGKPIETRFRLSEETDNILSRIEQESSKAYEEIKDIDIDDNDVRFSLGRARRIRNGKRLRHFIDTDFASASQLNYLLSLSVFANLNKGAKNLNNKRKKTGALFAEGLYDAMSPLRKYIEEIEKTYGKTLEESAYRLENMSQSKAQHRSAEFREFVEKPFAKILKRVEKELGGDIWRKYYGIAKVGLERQAIKHAEYLEELRKRNEEIDKLNIEAMRTGKEITPYEEEVTRDYAGLTGLLVHMLIDLKKLDLDKANELMESPLDEVLDFAKERGLELEKFVKECETDMGKDLVDNLWQTIRSISNAKLDNQLEAGLLSTRAYILIKHSIDINEIIKANLDAKIITEAQATLSEARGLTPKELLDKGIITPEQYELIINGGPKYKYYLPLKGTAELTAEKVVGDYDHRTPKDLSTIKSIRGHKKYVLDPFVMLMQDSYGSISNEEHNRWLRALLRTAQEYPIEGVKVSTVYLVPDYNSKGKKIRGSYHIASQAEINQGLALPFNDKLGFDDVYITNPQAKEHIVVVRDGGQIFQIQFADKHLADCINTLGGKLTKNKEVKIIKWSFDALNKVNRFVSSMLTSKNPAFIPFNLLRDYGEAVINNFITHGAKAVIPYMTAAQPTSELQLTLEWYLRWREGLVPSPAEINSKGKVKIDLDVWNLIEEFFVNGGETAYNMLADYESTRTKIKDLISNKFWYKSKNAIREIFRFIEVYGQHAELVSRLSTYAINRGTIKKYSIEGVNNSIEESIWRAKEITTNFDKKGSWSRYLGAFMLFFNAGRQSNRNQYNLFKSHPYRYLAAQSALILVASMMPEISYLISSWYKDDDDDEAYNKHVDDYAKINNHLKNNNFVMLINDEVITVPISPSFAPALAIAQVINTYRFSQESRMTPNEAWGSTMSTLVSTLWSDSFGGGLFSPMYDIAVNENYMGTPIYKEGIQYEGLPYWHRATSSTPNWLIEASRYINESAGGSDQVDKTGKWNNPASAQHLLSSATGGYWKIATDLQRWDDITDYMEYVQSAKSKAESEGRRYTSPIKGGDVAKTIPVINKIYRGNINDYLVRDMEQTYWECKDEIQALRNGARVSTPDDAENIKMYIDELSDMMKTMDIEMDELRQTRKEDDIAVKEMSEEQRSRSPRRANPEARKIHERKEKIAILRDIYEVEQRINEVKKELYGN